MNASSDLFDSIQNAFEAQGYRVDSISYNGTDEIWTVDTGTRPNLLTFTFEVGSDDDSMLFRSPTGQTVEVSL